MKVIILFLWFFLSITVHANGNNKESIKILISSNNPPYSMLDSQGGRLGLDVEIMRALCAEVEFKCILLPYKGNDILNKLASHQYDAAMSSLNITKERLDKFIFTKPYLFSTNTFLFKKEEIEKFKKSKGIIKQKIGVDRKSKAADYLKYTYSDKLTIIKYDSLYMAYNDLIKNNINAIFGDLVIMLKMKNTADFFRISGFFVDDKNWFGTGYGIALNKSDRSLKEKFDKALNVIQHNGVYNKIIHKYTPY